MLCAKNRLLILKLRKDDRGSQTRHDNTSNLRNHQHFSTFRTACALISHVPYTLASAFNRLIFIKLSRSQAASRKERQIRAPSLLSSRVCEIGCAAIAICHSFRVECVMNKRAIIRNVLMRVDIFPKQIVKTVKCKCGTARKIDRRLVTFSTSVHRIPKAYSDSRRSNAFLLSFRLV